MTNTFETNAQQCDVTTNSFHVEKPCNGSNASIALSNEAPTQFDFGLVDISGFQMLDDGSLMISFVDGDETLVIENYAAMADGGEFQEISLNDGETINLGKLAEGLSSSATAQVADNGLADELASIQPAAGDDLATLITKSNAYELNAGETYQTDFNQSDVVDAQVNDNGDLIISFADETQTTITNFKDIESAEDIPTMTLADGTVINVTDLLTQAVSVETTTEEVADVVAVAQPTPQAPIENNVEQEIAQARPEDLAAIEPAAGDTAPSGALGNTGANFGSSVSDIGLNNVDAVGPIGVTALQFDRPEFEDDDIFLSQPSEQPLSPVVDVTSVSGFEDNAIDFGVSASPSDPAECLEIIVSGIPIGWTPVSTDATTSAGVYDAGAGTWTINLLPGESLLSGPVFTPPLNSDADISPLTVTVNQKDPANGNEITGTTTSQFDVVVDAVADPIDLVANDVVGTEDTPVQLDLSTTLQDIDGSEEITEVAICNVPAGFTLNAGTEVTPGNWVVSQADLATLELTPPANYSGTVSLEIKVTNEEVNFSDNEFDFTNNLNVTTLPFDVTFTPVADAPILEVEDARVKEDGNVDLPIRAELTDPSETLTICVENLDSSWGVSIGTNNGVYNATTGVWEITLPAGQNYNGAINLTPPADTDFDMNDIRVKAISTESDGSTAETSETIDVVVDAVADAPTLSGADVNGTSGVVYPLNLANALTDTDGSESLGDVTISGVPVGFTLTAGTQLPNGDWVVSQVDVASVGINTPVGYEGGFDLSVSVTSTETPTDTEYDFTDNEATTTIDLRVDLTLPELNAPSVEIAGQHQVLEDGSVVVPFSAALASNALSTDVLTLTLSGIDPSWTITTGANNGVYDAASGTWTMTMPAGQDYTGAGLTFTPPADSDIDMSGLVLTATANRPTNGTNASANANSQIFVDAVADTPDVDSGADQTVTAGDVVALNFTNALTDIDGSESLGVVTVSGVPAGYSLSSGTQVLPGVWEVAQGDLAGLQLNTPSTGSGNVTLTVSVTSTESVTDADFDLTNNTATNTDTVVISVNPDNQPPEVSFGANGSGQGQVYEDGSIFVPITGALNGDAPQVLTVEVSGIPSDWTINNTDGTYNATTGTWTITLPEGQDYNGGLTFTPPADSDVDLTGLNVTATSTLVSDNSTTQTVVAGAVIVDAVADTPDVDAGVDQTVTAGDAVALNFTNALTDTDGSELLGVVTVSGVPAGYSLSSGTQVSPGVWEVAQADLAGLQLNTPSTGSGNVTLTVSVTSTESVTDADFDLTNNTATNTDTVVISINPDDKPIVTGATETVDETSLTTGNVNEAGSVSANFGADGPGTFEVNGDFQSSGARDNNALTHNGVAVVVTNVGDTYYGRAGGVDVFTLQVNADGSYAFNLIENLDHSDPNQANEEITLTFGFDAVDSDNDRTGGTITVNVRDDVPSITTRFKVINEDGLTSSNVITLTDTLVHSYGEDGPGSINPTDNFIAKHAMDGSNVTLTSDGVEIVVTSTANGYVGVAGGETIFDVVVNDNGQYTYRQFAAIDHQDTTSGNEVIWLKFEVAIVDFDGDTRVGYIGIDVQDSGPVANNDVVTMWSCDWATIGNVVTGYNQDNNGADRLSADGVNQLTSITSNGQTHEFKDGGNVMVVQLTYGTLIMFKDGTYSYISNQVSPKANQTENLSYTIEDADGDTSSANLRILVKEAPVTDNDASDYGNQTQGTNTVIDGEAAYQTNEVEGAQVFGWNDEDVLSGNVGNDALYGWVGDDKLYGDAGNDILLGEHDNNILEGGEGSDLFGLYGDKANNNTVFDTIVDFDISEGDVLSLTSVISGFDSGDDINDFVRINFDGDTAVVQVNTNGSGNDFYDVAKIQSHNDLDATTLNVQDLFDKGHIDVY